MNGSSRFQAVAPAVELALRVWQRLPIALKAVMVGSFVNGMGTTPWLVLSAINFKLWPSVPWAVPLIGVYLWFYWQYVGGRWWPRATAEVRRSSLRARSLSPRVWRWALAAGIVGWASILLLRVFFDTLVGVPTEKVPKYPLVTILSYILVTSAVAGIAEEAGFRGYMQGPIERRHGPVVAILVVGTMFWLAHLTSFIGHWWLFLAYFWYYLAAAALFGVLAHATDSILPGIVVHTIANLVGFGLVWWWAASAGAPTDGSDPRGTVLWTAAPLALVCGLAGVAACRRLAVEARREPHP